MAAAGLSYLQGEMKCSFQQQEQHLQVVVSVFVCAVFSLGPVFLGVSQVCCHNDKKARSIILDYCDITFIFNAINGTFVLAFSVL